MFSEFYVHLLYLSIVTSLICPFGDFFASAFKRLRDVKDFSNFIPGHGGVTDRLDSTTVMVVFVSFYLKEIINI